MHHIQKHILKILTNQATARFSELRPPRTDTNLFSYHLKSLLKIGLVAKNERQYTLSAEGLLYVDRISSERFEQRAQPKIITVGVLRDEEGRIALVKRTKQPFIDTWGLPSGKLHLGEAVAQAARREVLEKTGIDAGELTHAGDAYINTSIDGVLVSSVLAHVFVGQVATSDCPVTVEWVRWPEVQHELSPGVAVLIEKALSVSGQRFFVELQEQY